MLGWIPPDSYSANLLADVADRLVEGFCRRSFETVAIVTTPSDPSHVADGRRDRPSDLVL
jgi:hypothetical protein